MIIIIYNMQFMVYVELLIVIMIFLYAQLVTRSMKQKKIKKNMKLI